MVRNIPAVAIPACNARMTLVLLGTNIIVGLHSNFHNETNTVGQQAIYNKGVVNVALYRETN